MSEIDNTTTPESAENPKFDNCILNDRIELTLTNYINMRNRIYRRQKFSEIILIYYSFMLILNSLTLKYFNYNGPLSSYFGIALSILILTYSLINNASGYAVRVFKLDREVSKLKKIKRDTQLSLPEIEKQYHQIIDNSEMRDDVDFFKTLCQMCRKRGCRFVYFKLLFHWCKICHKIKSEEVNNGGRCPNQYLGELQPFLLLASNVLSCMKYIFLLLLPILMFIVCIKPPEWLIEYLKKC